MWPEPRVRERLGRGRGRDLQAKIRIWACSDGTGKPVVGSKQGCDNQICIWIGSLWHQCGQWGNVGRGEVGEEATVIVQARDDDGPGWADGYGVGMQPWSEVDVGTVDQMW